MAVAEPEVAASTPCPVRGPGGARCNRPVAGVDPMRTCPSCRAAGAPPRVPWEIAKPERNALGQPSATVLPEIVMEPLANAGMSEMAIHAAPESARDAIGTQVPPDTATLVQQLGALGRSLAAPANDAPPPAALRDAMLDLIASAPPLRRTATGR